MNRRIQPFLRSVLGNRVWLAGLAACFAVMMQMGGCASSRPAPLLIESQAGRAPSSESKTEAEPDYARAGLLFGRRNWLPSRLTESANAGPAGPPVRWERAQSPPLPGATLSLRLVTYNIWGLPSWMTGAPHGRYPRIAREVERLDPDIVLLQEAWTAQARTAAPVNGPWSVVRAASQHTFFQQCGLVTLSKFPVVGGEFYPFSQAAWPDRLVNKGVLKTTLQMPGGRVLNVWNVHLQDGGPAEVRLSQVRELVSRVEAAEDGQFADVVGGDFNCTPESLLFRELSKSFGRTVQQLSGGEPFVTWDGLSSKPGAGQTLDHIFVRERARLQSLQAVQQVAFNASSLEQRMSDHFGIEAVLKWGPPPSLAGGLGPLVQNPPWPAVGFLRANWSADHN